MKNANEFSIRPINAKDAQPEDYQTLQEALQQSHRAQATIGGVGATEMRLLTGPFQMMRVEVDGDTAAMFGGGGRL